MELLRLLAACTGMRKVAQQAQPRLSVVIDYFSGSVDAEGRAIKDLKSVQLSCHSTA